MLRCGSLLLGAQMVSELRARTPMTLSAEPYVPFCGWSGFYCPKSPTPHPFSRLAKSEAIVLG